MPNALTGDFDVVAMFAVPAVNRLLAAMHRVERFPHSIAVRVDDIPIPPDRPGRPVLVEVIDLFGETVADHDRIGLPVPITGDLFGTNPAFAGLDAIVNPELEIFEPGVEASQLQGRAQLQVSPPTIHLTDSSGTNVTVKMGLMARYFPDPGTPRVAEFVRGELTITASVLQAVSQGAGRVIDVDIRSSNVTINFAAQWSSTPLSAEDTAGINLLIRNAIRSSFLPSNSRLPSDVAHIQFKTLSSSPGAVAVLLNMTGNAGNRASIAQSFLTGADHFGFAASADYVRAAFQPTIDRILSDPVDPVKFKIESLVHTWHVTYTITLNDASVVLENGVVALIVRGHAHTGTSWLPDFNFTSRFEFTLEPDGATVNLVPGDISLDTSSWIINRFRSGGIASLRRVRDRALQKSDANASVREMLSAEENLGEFLDSLLKPVRKDPIVEPRLFSLAYTAAEIKPDGVVLHGALSVTSWPAPHVEYEMIETANGGGPGGVVTGIVEGPDYSALKSWIPGGRIDGYEWKRFGQAQPGFVDGNRFVHLHQPPVAAEDSVPSSVVSGRAPLCVTVRGTRLSSSGPVVEQPVSATFCGFNVFPGLDAIGGDLDLLVALAAPAPDGTVRVHGEASTKRGGGARLAPNVIVHVPGDGTPTDAALLLRAVREAERADAPVAVIYAAKPDQIARTRFVEGITYAEDDDGRWLRQIGMPAARIGATAIVDASGKAVWLSEGELNVEELARALRANLARGTRVKPAVGRTAVRIGERPPNFIFEHAPGHMLTLRKLAGRAVTLVFSRDGSETARDAGDGALLVVHDGEPSRDPEQRSSSRNGPAIHVPDPARRIAGAYGITMWPTTISIDALGAVRSIQYGRRDDRAPTERSKA